MPLPIEQDEALRVRGWDVFRRRDGIVPQPAGGRGAVLRRVAIMGVRPAAGVLEGAVPVPAAAEEGGGLAGAARRRTAEEAGQSYPLSYYFTNPVALPGPADVAVDVSALIGLAPDNGVVTELVVSMNNVLTQLTGVALRSSSGATFFESRSLFASGVPETRDLRPDFFPLVDLFGSVANASNQWRLLGGMPVSAGEQLFLIMRFRGTIAANTARVFGSVVITSAVAGGLRVRLRPAAAIDFGEVAAAARPAPVAPTVYYPVMFTTPVEGARLRAQGWTQLTASTWKGPGVVVPAGAAPPAPPAGSPGVSRFERWMTEQASVTASPGSPAFARVQAAVAYLEPPPPSGTGLVYVPSWLQGPGLPHGYLIPIPRRGQRIRIEGEQWFAEPPVGDQAASGRVIFLTGSTPVPPGALLSSPGRIITSDMVRGLTLVTFRGEQMTREDAEAILAAERAGRA